MAQAQRRTGDPFGQDAPPDPPRVPRGVPANGTHNAHVPPEECNWGGGGDASGHWSWFTKVQIDVVWFGFNGCSLVWFRCIVWFGL